jgi:hypothetical protein
VTGSDRFQDRNPHPGAARRARQPEGVFQRLVLTLRALRRWWAGERRYRPERHYMRGGHRDGAAAAAHTAQGR